jgi:acetyl-CoA carboxylase carboxyltransferase component
MGGPDVQRVEAPLVGTVIRVVETGQAVNEGEIVAIIESMKMEYAIATPVGGSALRVAVSPGQSVAVGDLLVEIDPRDAPSPGPAASEDAPTLAEIRLAELREREALLDDAARNEAVNRRHALGLRTARENLADLVDPGSFVEYGRFAYAAQTQRRAVDDLIATTPGDGLVAGLGTVNADVFGPEAARCAVLSYDYMVLAGTQGQRNHQKKDRLFELVERLGVPVVFFTEGGGGRPGDTDRASVTGLDTDAFRLFARLSGRVPTIGIAAGRCFAGNAALLGCCDVVIACAGASIGMGGPAMIEGGGLGVVSPEQVGPVPTHARAGSVDLVVADEAEAVAAARRLLALWQGTRDDAGAVDQELVRSILPGDRRRAYDVRPLIGALFDSGSVLELRGGFGAGMVTALARLGGRAVGVLANNPAHLSGAIDAEGADKAARFLQLLEAWGLPVVSLVDTPGFMVGPEAEATGLVRHASRMFVVGASLSVPILSVVTRRGYGLGAQAMCGGSFVAPLLTVAWPQAELGGMGLEGAVRLGFRHELEAIADEDERERALARLVERAYENGRALNVAAHLELDDVIDPASTRDVLMRALAQVPTRLATPGPRFVDPW